MRKPPHIAQCFLDQLPVILMTLALLVLIHLAPSPAEAQTLHANGKIAFTSNRDGSDKIYRTVGSNTEPVESIQLLNHSWVR